MIRRPPRSTLFPTRRSSDLTRLDRLIGHHRERSLERGVFGYHQAKLPRRSLLGGVRAFPRSEEHTSELQSQSNLVCRLLLEKKKKEIHITYLHIHDIMYTIF